MKILKYIAIIAVSAIACVSYAQQAATSAEAPAPVAVKVSNVKGVPTYNITVNPSAKTQLTSEEAIKKALAAAMGYMDPKSVDARAINASLLALKAVLANKNAPMAEPMHIEVKISNKTVDGTNVAVVATLVTVGGNTYEANTETSVNASTDVAQTTGNIAVKDQSGATTTAPVSVSVNANGNLVGTVGDAGVTDQTVSSTSETVVSDAPASTQDATQDYTTPDATLVTSSTR